LLLIAMALEVPPATTVNGEELAPAEETVTIGPARVCLRQTSVDLLDGEKAYLEYLGIHWGGIRVVGPHGEYRIREGNAWARPRSGVLRLSDDRGRRIDQVERNGRLRYLLYGRIRDREDVPMVWVEGAPLQRTGGDRIIDRITIFADDPPGCRRRFLYGWDVILPAEEK
jgi:hypothetical protein